MTPNQSHERWLKLDQLLDEVIELAPAAQTAFLDRACAGDPELRRELEALLLANRQADGLLEAPPPTASDLLLDRQAEALVGRHIGRYQILREIGRGGMGIVCLAERADDQYRQQAAVKLLWPGLHNAEIIRRFRRERQILVSLHHPNIAQLYDGGTTADGRPYFVMEYVAGAPLTDYCNMHQLSIDERLRLFQQVCAAVQYAHQNLVIHRDLKPSNILVTAAGEVKLLDFGIARVLDPARYGLTAQPTTSALMMTPEYASPEQMRGEQITTASDVYSLGVVLYELLTGQSPYQFKDRSLPELLRVVCEQEPQAPSEKVQSSAHLLPQFGQARPEQWRARLRGDLDQITRTALQKDQPLRYRSVEQLSEDIRRYLEGEAITARTASWFYQTEKFVRRNKTGVALAALLLLTLLGGIVATTRQARVANEQARINRRLAYAGQMHQAVQAWETANMGQLRDLVEQSKPQPGEEDLRGFEWYHLWRLTYRHGERYSLPHPTDVWTVAFAPVGQRVATGANDGKLRLWEAGRALATLSGHTGNIWAVAFSPDGQRVATGSSDRTAKLWDAATGRELVTFNGHTHQVMCVAFSPDGKTLATGSRDNTLKLWDVGTGRELRSIQSNASWVNAVAFSPNGRLLATGQSAQPNLKLWDAITGRQLRAFNEFPGGVFSVAFAPDGKSLALGDRNRLAQLFEVSSGKLLATFKGHTGEVKAVAFAPDGKLLATGSADRTVKLWQAATGEEVATLKGHLGQIWSVAFAPDGQSLATSGDDHTARLWDMPTALEFTALKLLGNQRAFAVFSPDGRKLAVIHHRGTVRLLNAATGRELVTFAGQADTVQSLAFSPDGNRLATGHQRGTAKLWDAATGQELMTFKGHTAQVDAVTFSPDGQRLATASQDKTVKVWQAATGQELVTFKGHTNLVRDVAFSPDGKRLASGGYDHVARLWDAATGRELAVFNGHTEPLLALAFAPDGKTLATGSADNTAKLWEVATGRALGAFKGHAGHVRCLAFAPDGTRLATGSAEGMVRLWDVATQQEIIALKGHDDVVGSVAFAPDGQTLVSSGTDGIVRFWRAATEQDVLQAKR